MLQTITIANYVEEKLNIIAKDSFLSFRIFSNAGRCEHSNVIYGEMSVVSSSGAPLPSIKKRNFEYVIRFLVTDHFLGENIQLLNEYVNEFISAHQGVELDMDGGKAVFTFGTPSNPQGVKDGGMGVGVKTTLEFSVLHTENAATSSSKVWLLNGEKLPYLDESIEIEKEGDVKSVFGLKATQSFLMRQTKVYKFTLPYDSSFPILRTIQKDMLEGDMAKVYSLSYYDGIAFTEDAPYLTKVSLFRTASSGVTCPGISNFSVAFTDVDDGTTGSRFYEMALIDNPFDDGSVNARWFESRAKQEVWFANKIANGLPYSAIKAPNLNSLTITQQVYFAPNKPDTAPIDLNTLLTKNYAIIHTFGSDKVSRYYYYYIQSATVGSNNQILVDLKMDTIQTYYFDPDINITDCTIDRTHLNRWVKSENKVSFDNSPTSALLNTESTMLPKRLIERTPIYPGIDLDGGFVNSLMQETRENWVVVLLQKNDVIKEIFKDPYPTLHIKDFDTGLVCLIAPMFNAWYTPTLANEETGEWVAENIFKLLAVRSDILPFIVAYKITPICPIAANNYAGKYKNYTNLPYYDTIQLLNMNDFNLEQAQWGEGGNEVLVMLTKQSEVPAFFDFDIPFNTTFEISEIMNKPKNSKYNPKMLSNTCREINIVDYAGNSFTYDIQKINSSKVRFLFNEVITADLTKGYARIKDNDNSAYNNGIDKNYTGLMYSNDTVIPFVIDKYAEFFAQNKNYALMQQAQRDYGSNINDINNISTGIRGGLGVLGNIATGNFLGALSGGLNSATDIVANNARLNSSNDLSIKNEAYTLNNMRSAPGSLKNAQGNVLANFLINEANLAFFVEIYSFLTQDGEKFNDYCHLFGFSYERTGKIKNFDNNRHYFNYIQASIETIGGISMSNDARNDIRQRFSTGIRFWNSDVIQYDLENYEKWIIT